MLSCRKGRPPATSIVHQDDTIILFSGVYRDANNVGLVPGDVLDTLNSKANRPIFALSRTYLGHGVIGGAMIDPADYGKAAANRLTEMLTHPAVAIPPAEPRAAHAVTLDYRQLQRWGLPDRRLPPGAAVLFRPPGLWEAYREQVILALGALLLQSALLVVLLAERARRRRAEESMRKLSADLLVSQEDERQRIARDLHDGVNQRVALVAVGLDGAAALPETDAQSRGMFRRLADGVRDIGSEIHAATQGPIPGIGLTSMKERLNLLGGKLSIRSRSEGTLVIARIPLPEDAEPHAA